MKDSFYIAWRYVSFNRVKTATLIACITLILFLPLALQLLLDESERQLLSRAVSTPLVVGEKGSALDLIMSTLYFGEEVPELISMDAALRVDGSGLALPIPIYVRFRARGYPVVGTTLDYFDFRGLRVAEGRQLAMLGDCVVGASVADDLGLKGGDSLVTSPENLFDLAGIYPLKMHVTGVLKRSHTPDDLAIFVDLKTAWVIQGLGHGHQDLARIMDESVVLKRTDKNVTASAKLLHYTEITGENIDSFHFHGDTSSYPITAVIALPPDSRSGTILRGKYLSREERSQIVKPEEVIDGLLKNIFRIKSVLDAVISVVSLATIMALILIFALSLRLREGEIDTIFRLGCSRATVVKLIGAEVSIIGAASLIICSTMVMLVNHFSHDLVRMLFIR